jgi:hypothetical protein
MISLTKKYKISGNSSLQLSDILPAIETSTLSSSFFSHKSHSSFPVSFKMVNKASVAAALLATIAAASPAPRHPLIKRFEDGVDCTSSEVATSGTPGLFFAVDSEGHTMSCDEAETASSDA